MGAAATTHGCERAGAALWGRDARGARPQKGALVVSTLLQPRALCCHAGSAGEEIVLCRTQTMHGDAGRLQTLLHELFCLQDLNSDGLLDEDELVALNERIAILHYGEDVDREAIRDRFVALFRERLDPDGLPVPFETFCGYMSRALEGIDGDSVAQVMIAEQFVAEAALARSFCAARTPSRKNAVDEVIAEIVSRRPSQEVRPLITAAECESPLWAKSGFAENWVHAL